LTGLVEKAIMNNREVDVWLIYFLFLFKQKTKEIFLPSLELVGFNVVG